MNIEYRNGREIVIELVTISVRAYVGTFNNELLKLIKVYKIGLSSRCNFPEFIKQLVR